MRNRLFTFAMAAAVSAAAMAQFEGTTPDERIAATAGEDSVTVGRGHISMFQMGLQNQDYKESYISWKWLMKHAPFANTGIYKQSPLMFYNLNLKETDQAQKEIYFRDMMKMFDLRLSRLDSLNSMERRERLKSSVGDVMAVKAEFYNYIAPTIASEQWTPQKSYEYFEQAIKTINENGGREVSGSFLQNFIYNSDMIYKADPAGKREQYLQDYLDSKDACEKMLALATEAAQAGDSTTAHKYVAMYSAPLAFIEQTFAASGAADKAQIIQIYTNKFDTYKNNIDKLNSSLNLMAQNDCDTEPIYFQYAKAAYNLKPTFISSIGLAQKAMKDGNASSALNYYNKAIELAADDNARSKICINIARAMASSGAYSKSEEYTEKAIGYNNECAGHAYYQMANNMVRAKNFGGALAYCDKAAAADITIAPRAKDLKNRIATAQAQIEAANKAAAANSAANAAYQEYLRKKAAEEAFWRGSKK